MSQQATAVPDITIVIVNWNTADLTADCLRSIYAPQPPANLAIDVIVVDNGSSDDSVTRIRSEFPQVTLIENSDNVGFAGANNQGITLGCGRYMLLLNSDTVVHPGALETLVAFMDACPDAGACGARLLNADGTLQESCYPFPSLFREAWRLFHLDRLSPQARYAMDEWDTDAPRAVDVLMGACLCLRRDVLEEVGLMDEGYFMYSEEMDLCLRIHRTGSLLFWVPQAVVTHYWGQSSKLMATKMFLQLYRSKVRYFRKHYGRLAAAAYKCILGTAATVRIAMNSVTAFQPDNQRVERSELAYNYRCLLKEVWTY